MLKVCAVALATLLISLSFAETAVAQVRAVTDPKSDVAHYDWHADKITTGAYKYDLTGTSVRHRMNTVEFSATYKSVDACGWCFITFHIDTNNDRVADFYANADGYITKASGREVWCGAEGELPYRDTLRVRADRVCFGKPKTVRVRAEMYQATGAPCCPEWYRDRTRWSDPASRG